MSVAWLKAMDAIDSTFVEDLHIIEDSGWTNDVKWQHKDLIVQLTGDEVFDEEGWPVGDVKPVPGYYRVRMARSGSYWDDYEYDDYHYEEVEPYEEVVTKWRNKL